MYGTEREEKRREGKNVDKNEWKLLAGSILP